LKQYGPGKPDGAADKGLLDANQGTDVAPTPKPAGQASIAGGEQFEMVDPSSVAGGKKAGMSQHAGAPDGFGPGPSFTAQKESRGIHEMGHAFSAAAGNSPKRSAGRKTQASDIDKLKTAGS
jgi:hypothetical protein